MVAKSLVSVVLSDDGHERVGLTPKGEEAYKKIVQWVNEIIHGKTPGS